jgi:LacI family transcriptional regulator
VSDTKHSATGSRAGRPPTLKDVAKEAGVSVGMASRVLGDYGSFSDATRVRVVDAARALAYRPNAVARSLRVGRTKALGLAVTNLSSYHWITFIRGVEAAASSHGYQVILGHTGDDPARERDHIRALYQRNVDGLIIAPTNENEARIRDLVDAGFPVVLTESSSTTIAAPCINIADHRAAYSATTYLIGLGHERIGTLAGDLELASGVDRLRGYHDGLRDRGIAVDEALVGRGEYRFEPAFAETDRLMSLPEPPTALLVSNETMLGATLQCLKERGLRVGDDVSLIAFDDPPWATFVSPSITTIRTPRERMGAMAVHMLVGLLEAGPDRVPHRDLRVVESELVVRESCRPRS